MTQHKINTNGCYVIKSAESRPKPVDRCTPKSFVRTSPTDKDRALARAVLDAKARLS